MNSRRSHLSLLAGLLASCLLSTALAACDRTQQLQNISDCPLVDVPASSDAIELRLQPFLLQVSGCTMWTRAYAYGSGSATVPGPTMHIQNGSTFKVDLYNDLERGGQVDLADGVIENSYHEPNTTNLHTHGLHVSGESPGDDVSTKIKPGQSFSYQIGVPSDHASGLHFYHAHHHGSTSLQIGGGAAGLLVMDENEGNTPQGFVQTFGDPIRLILQHIDPTEVRSSANACGDDLFEVVEGCASSFHLVNGLMNPLITLVPGQWTRIAFSHVSTTVTATLSISGCSMWLLAKDGVWLHEPRTVSQLVLLQPSRAEVLLRCSADSTIYDSVSTSTLATIKVAGSAVTDNLDETQWSWDRPFYLSDLRTETVDNTFNARLAGRAINGISFAGFSQANSLHDANLGDVEEWTIDANAHPIHIHVNHMQLQADTDDWNRAGDWVDTFQGRSNVRMRMDTFTGKVVMHCHISDHAELGLLGVYYINGPPATTAAPTPEATPEPSTLEPTTSAPTTAATDVPSTTTASTNVPSTTTAATNVPSTTTAATDVPSTEAPTEATNSEISSPAARLVVWSSLLGAVGAVVVLAFS